MDVGLYFRLFRRNWIVILLLAVLGTAAGALVAWAQNPLYAAKSQMVVSASDGGSDLSEAYQGDLLSQQRAKSYATLLTSQHVSGRLIDRLNLPYSVEKLQGEISASNPVGTAVIDVTVEDGSAARAREIANAIGPVFAGVVGTVEEPGGREARVRVVSLQPAQVLGRPVFPHKTLDVVLGLIAGLVLGVVWSVLREMTNNRIRDAADAVRSSGVSVLGAVAAGGSRQDKVLLPGTPRPRQVVESYRRLAVNVMSVSSGTRPQSFVVAAPHGGESAAKTSAGLAIALAENGTAVTLVDAASSGGPLAALMGLPPGRGLRDVLAGRVPADRAQRAWREDLPLRVLTSGLREGDSSDEPLREPALAALGEELARTADVVIFASPAVLTETDAVVLARAVGQVLVVVRTNVTPESELQQSVQSVRLAGATVLGVVLGDAPRAGSRRQVVHLPQDHTRSGGGRGSHDGASRLNDESSGSWTSQARANAATRPTDR